MYEIGVVDEFEAAHRLVGDFGPAGRRHGHTYRVEVVARGEQLQPDGTLVDLGVLQDAVRQTTSALHYRDLDELPQFSGRNTTAEAVARHVYDEVARLAGESLRARAVGSLAVRVWESPRAWAGYEGPWG
jgi:6-pyruvoyltetrahydropterin/6-carboxytetrahydropterin synthase